MAVITKKSIFKGISVEHVRSPRTLFDPNRRAVFKGITVERVFEPIARPKDFTLFFGTI